MDTKLTWGKHVDAIISTAKKRLNAIQRIAGAAFGPDRKTLKSLYISLIRSSLEHASEVFGPGLGNTYSKKIERIQNQAMRVIAGVPMSTPLVPLRVETGLQSLDHRRKTICQTRYETCKRYPDSHPVKRAVNMHENEPPPKRRKRNSFCEEATTNNPCPPTRDPTPTLTTDPSQTPYPRVKVNPYLLFPHGDDRETKLAASYETLTLYEGWIKVYTDGSKTDTKAGAGFLIEGVRPPVHSCFSADYNMSIAEIESKAILRALQHLKLNPWMIQGRNIAVLTDSQASLKRLESVLAAQYPPPAVISDVLMVVYTRYFG